MLKHPHNNRFILKFPAQNGPRCRQPLVTAWLAPASEGRLQYLLARADQMPRCFDRQIGVLGYGQRSLARVFGKIAIGERLQTPGNATEENCL